MLKISRTQFDKDYPVGHLQELSVFGALNQDFVGHLLDQAEIYRTEKNDRLFSAGHRPNGFYILIEGNSTLYCGPHKENKIVNVLEPGECVGFISMLSMNPVIGDVTPVTGSVVLRISDHLFASLPEIDGEQSFILLMNLTRNICRAYIKHAVQN
ncbi:cyclic nucleotide-binding domain-containing protein [Aliamphritea hakodatensis]|uniref:cyclic nucleotide-binding domain-containing protein n=1 Tax=Aliamphritea hakodatensis TaxID=2895352 RepID=UPI0022FDAF57|nr:Crp/Fnr family transcriptional regulator [Aliamphritea hakodatensis]